jgi:putative phosphoesterase
MKFLVLTDIHGSIKYLKMAMEKFSMHKCEKILLLGDLLYHGPRNDLPLEYNPKEVISLLNSYKDKIISVKGNCDAEVDEMISEFVFNEHIKLNINNKKFMFSHGHHVNIDNKVDGIDVLVYGHFHTGFIKCEDNVIYVNSGSLSLPKNNTANSFLIITDEFIELRDIENNLIEKSKY